MSDVGKIALVLVGVLVVAFIGYAAVNFTNNVNVVDSEVVYVLDGEVWNGTIVDWGNMRAGQVLNKTLDVHNLQNKNITTVLVAAQPEDWVLTWTLNNTVIVNFSNVTGFMQLTAPENVTTGLVSFTANISD